MNRRRFYNLYNILILITASLIWLGLLGLWIYWYVSNYLIFEKVGDQLSPQIILDEQNVAIFVGGLILLVGIFVLMGLIFRHLNVQLKLNALYDNFISNVTHELKSPLSSIQLYLETLSSRKVPQEKQKEFLEMMNRDTNRLNNLINSILEISALEQKKIAHDFQIADAETTVRLLIKESAEILRIPDIAISFSGEANCRCVIDKSAMRIVFDNLLDNARKYSTGEVRIIIKLKCTAKYFQIDVTDFGIGIDSKDQKKIFNKFQRLTNKNVPNVKGTGLGLYWVKQILRYHGGSITVFSEGEARGTTFRILLPIYLNSKINFSSKLLRDSEKRKKLKEPEYE